IQGRQLPDKAVSLIDTACARVAVSLHAVPAEIDDTRKRIDGMNTVLPIIDREIATGSEHTKRRAELVHEIQAEDKRLKDLEDHYGKEKAVVEKILDLRGKLRRGTDQPIDQGKTPAGAPATPAPKDAKPPVQMEPKLSDDER